MFVDIRNTYIQYVYNELVGTDEIFTFLIILPPLISFVPYLYFSIYLQQAIIRCIFFKMYLSRYNGKT